MRQILKHISISRLRENNLNPIVWIINPEETSPEVQNRSISGPTKWTYVLQKFVKKKCHERFGVDFHSVQINLKVIVDLNL